MEEGGGGPDEEDDAGRVDQLRAGGASSNRMLCVDRVAIVSGKKDGREVEGLSGRKEGGDGGKVDSKDANNDNNYVMWSAYFLTEKT